MLNTTKCWEDNFCVSASLIFVSCLQNIYRKKKTPTRLIGYKCKLVDFNIGKKKVNIKSEYFRPFATSRHNHCRQVHPARATVWSAERLMTPSLIEKSALGLESVSWVRRWPVIDWPLGHFGSAGSGVVENPNRGRWKSKVSLKHRCVGWQMDLER